MFSLETFRQNKHLHLINVMILNISLTNVNHITQKPSLDFISYVMIMSSYYSAIVYLTTF